MPSKLFGRPPKVSLENGIAEWLGSKCSLLADLESNRTNLINIVESLGEYINDEALAIRSKAVQFLSGVIGELPPPFLSRPQVNVLCQFYCDRIDGGGAVEGLKTLQGMTRFNQEMAAITFRA